MSEKQAQPTTHAEAQPPVPKSLQKGWRGLWWRLRSSVLPEIHFLPGEKIKLEIRMAPYRRQVPLLLAKIGGVAAGGLAVAAIIVSMVESAGVALAIDTFLWAAVFACIVMVIAEAETILLYEQWRFILTDKRIIIVSPDPEQRGFADAIYLKGGKIQVLDTNWSKNPFWGLFQATQGARDVTLSMSGYEFKETGAQVKGGLRFPDVMPGDVQKLEELIFG